MRPKSKTGADNPQALFPIVAIGASAGGLSALETFLPALPNGFGFALIFMQHLSPKHKNLLPELLRSRTAGLPIEEAADGVDLVPGKLYLCPPAREVRVENNVFHVTARSKPHTHLPIDELFLSLSVNAPERTIAVVFSGAGTDGTRGIQAVRKTGGTVFVQDPADAEYPDMPLSAISTGQTDGILTPDNIAREIVKFHLSGVASSPADGFMGPADFDALFRLIDERTGHHFNHYKKNVIARRVRRRIYLHGLSTTEDYLKLLAGKDSEAIQLASDLMIGVTSFFRDRLAWKALHLEVTRKLVAEEDHSPIRVWTPACATGEEAYSVAMLLQHDLDLAGKKREIQVFATDVNDHALDRARDGQYPATVSADLPPDYLNRFFTPAGDGLSLVVNKDIRQQVVFARHDLLTDPPFSRLDLVICRNLLIYLEADAQEKCINLFHYALKKGGFLFLGNAESPGRNSSLFLSLNHKKCRVYRKAEVRPRARIPLSIPFAAERSILPSKQKSTSDHHGSLTQFIQEALLEAHAPAAVAINQNYDILYHNGPTNRYLRQPRGTPTQNFLEQLPDKLRNRIRAALYRASQDAKSVAIRTTITDENERKKQVTIGVSKLRENLFLIAFREKGGQSNDVNIPSLEMTNIEETVVRQLENELASTRDDLQSHIEQLRSLNEELESSNEEFQAANEELETSREELQSLNEELTTVNAQLQTKIEEQEETNNDLNNFFTSTNIPTVFLDLELNVKRFTPAMSRLVTLIPADVGRPIMDMSQVNLGSDFIADARSVLNSLTPVRKELSIDGVWYIRTTLPYRTADNRIEGVVITYNDITEIKGVEKALEESRRHLSVIVDNIADGFFAMDREWRINHVNDAALRHFDMGHEQVVGRLFLDVFPQARGTIFEIEYGRAMESGKAVHFEVTSIITDKIMEVHAYPGPENMTVLFRDITERRQAEETRRHLASFPELNPNPVMEVSAAGELLYCNPSSYKILEKSGMTREDWSALLPQDLSAVLANWDKETSDILAREVAVEDRVFEESLQLVPEFKVARIYARDITERKQVEDALYESERRVRMKLESILSPEGDTGKLELSDIIDVPAIQSLMDDFYGLARIPLAIIDLKGAILVSKGWQEICTQFHRVHPESCAHCIESDLQLSAGIPFGESRLYKCKNNMWDIATPIVIGGQHVGSVFSGQFFFEGEKIDYDLFRTQARQYGFNEEDYIRALDTVPLFKRETVDTGMSFFMKLAQIVSQLSYSNLKLARSLAQGEALAASLKQNEGRLKRAQEIAHLGSWELDLVNNHLFWSDEVYRIFGLQPQEFAATYEAFLEAIHPDDRTAVDNAYTSSIREGRDTYEIEHRVVRRSTREVRVVYEKCEHIRDESGQIIRSVGMVFDVTERKRSEDRIDRLTKLYVVLSRVNEIIVRTHDEGSLLGEICRILAEEGGFPLVWIGMAQEQDVIPAAYCGTATDYLKEINVKISGVLGRGPTGTCIRENRTVINDNFASNTAVSPWYEAASKYGLRASAAFPLHRLGETVGAFTIYAFEANAFDAEQVRLLESLSADISYALDAFEQERLRVQSEANLIKEKETWERTFASVPDLIAILDNNHRILQVNEAMAQRLGIQADDCIGLPCYNVVHGLNASPFFCPHSRTMKDGKQHIEEIHEERLNGDFEVSTTPIYDDLGQMTGSVHIIHDVTERKKADTAVRQSLERFALLADTAGELLQTPDPRLAVKSVAARVMEHLDCQAFFNFIIDDEAGKLRLNAYAGIPEEEGAKIEWLDYGVAVCGCAARDNCRIVAEHIPTTPDVRTELVKSYGIKAYAAHPLQGPGGKVFGTLSFGTRTRETFSDEDLSLMRAVADQMAIAVVRMNAEEAVKATRDELEERVQQRTAELSDAYDELRAEVEERKKTEEKLRQAHKMEAIGTLAGGIAHDFNNILAAIMGFTEMVIEDLPEGGQEEKNLRYVLKSAHRGKDLVKQILAFSRKSDYVRGAMSLTPLIEETIQLLRASIPTTIEIVFKSTTTEDTVLASPTEMQQILINLATNAALAMEDKGGALEISLNDIDFQPDTPAFDPGMEPGEYIQLAVKDAGHGMTPEVMKRIFEPFFTTREVGKGTGMGLAMVYGIVADLHGAITVESEPGVGSIFRLFLPKVKSEIPAKPVTTDDDPRGKERVLFLDDEEILVELGRAALTRLGYEVTSMTNSTETLKIFSADPFQFDLVVTDQTMPGLTGMQLAQKLLNIRPDIPIVLCTGHSETVTPEEAQAAGISKFLMKPVNKTEFARTIRSVLDEKAGIKKT